MLNHVSITIILSLTFRRHNLHVFGYRTRIDEYFSHIRANKYLIRDHILQSALDFQLSLRFLFHVYKHRTVIDFGIIFPLIGNGLLNLLQGHSLLFGHGRGTLDGQSLIHFTFLRTLLLLIVFVVCCNFFPELFYHLLFYTICDSFILQNTFLDPLNPLDHVLFHQIHLGAQTVRNRSLIHQSPHFHCRHFIVNTSPST